MHNATSSMVALVWLNLLSIIAIPIYIAILGIDEWGIVAACVSLQIIANFVDAGFSQIVPRWVARTAGNRIALREQLIVFGKIYFILALVIFAFIQLAANYLSHDWFDIDAPRADRLEIAIRIVGFQIFFQFLNNLPIGFWHGMQRQVTANLITCAFGTSKHILTMLVLVYLVPLAYAYAMCFAIIAFFELLVNSVSLRKMLRSEQNETHAAFNILIFLREVSLLSAGVLVGLLVSQLDRIVLSRSVPIELFGIYSVTISVAMAFLQLQIPFTRAYFPILAGDYEKHGTITLVHCKKLFGLTVVAAVLPAVVLSFFASTILELWLGNNDIVQKGAYPLQLLLLAVAVNSLYGCIYQVIVASGRSHLVLKFNLVSLCVALLVVAIAGTSMGLVLGGVLWLSTTLTQLALGSCWLALAYHRSLFSKQKVTT